MEENEDIKLLFEEARVKLEISKAASDKYGSQAGITLYEILLELDVSPVVLFEDERITLAHKGVAFPIWKETVRTIDPKALRSPSICPQIRDLVNAAKYCFKKPPSGRTAHESQLLRSIGLDKMQDLC